MIGSARSGGWVGACQWDTTCVVLCVVSLRESLLFFFIPLTIPGCTSSCACKRTAIQKLCTSKVLHISVHVYTARGLTKKGCPPTRVASVWENDTANKSEYIQTACMWQTALLVLNRDNNKGMHAINEDVAAQGHQVVTK